MGQIKKQSLINYRTQVPWINSVEIGTFTWIVCCQALYPFHWPGIVGLKSSCLWVTAQISLAQVPIEKPSSSHNSELLLWLPEGSCKTLMILLSNILPLFTNQIRKKSRLYISCFCPSQGNSSQKLLEGVLTQMYSDIKTQTTGYPTQLRREGIPRVGEGEFGIATMLQAWRTATSDLRRIGRVKGEFSKKMKLKKYQMLLNILEEIQTIRKEWV